MSNKARKVNKNKLEAVVNTSKLPLDGTPSNSVGVPLTPVPLPSIQSSNVTVPHDLESRKLNQEIDKLKYDNSFWGRHTGHLLAAVGALTTLGIAMYTGVFEATRKLNDAQSERLRIEKIKLTEEGNELRRKHIDLNDKIEVLQSKLASYELEEEAIAKLRAIKNVAVTLNASLFLQEITVSITPNIPSLFSHQTDQKNAVYKTELTDAVAESCKMRHFTGIRVFELFLQDNDLALINKHPKLNKVLLSGTGLSSESLRLIGSKDSLRVLALPFNKIETLSHANKLYRLESLNVSSNPLTDEGIIQLGEKFPNLSSLDLSSTLITDKGIDSVTGVQSLTLINVNITLSAINKLTQSPKVKYVYVGASKFNEQEIMSINKNLKAPKVFRMKEGAYAWMSPSSGEW